MKYVTCFATLVALAASCNALALGAIASVTIIDRDSGAALSPYYFHGEYWVAGKPGARYAIEIRNCIGGRVLAVTSVDGVNILSGATAGWDQAGYVFDPGESYQVTGWRKSNSEVAAFTFSDSRDSYAERTGRPANVGVIGVAIFRERQPQAAYRPMRPRITERAGEFAARAREAQQPLATATTSPVAPSQDMSGGSVTPSLPAPKLGTGHGEREYSYVADTEFRRLQPAPNEVIRIRYDSLENLVAMGIVRGPRPPVPAPNPFPSSQERRFVPDPPG